MHTVASATEGEDSIMFQDTSDALLTWAREVLGDVPVRLGSPSPGPTTSGVAFHLLDITPHAGPNGEQYRRLHATLRYLATASAPDASTAHNLLGRVMVAAMQHKTFTLDREPPPTALWQALGVPPQPALLLKCHAHHELSRPEPSPSRRTIYASTPSSHLDGRVVGADGRPVEQATVVVPKYEMRARTDDGGHFHLPPLPRHETATLVVHAHGRQQTVDLVQAGGRSPGLVIQLDR
jgi:hypothetical protein